MKHLKFLSLILAFCALLTLFSGCKKAEETPASVTQNDIVVLFTNDIHCCMEGSVSIAEIAAYKSYLQSKTENVLLVDCGDAVQGNGLGTVSNGSILIDVMNEIGYDYAIFGNHEFDYGQDRLIELVSRANAQYLCCNMTYSGSGTTALSQTKPYAIEQFGNRSVAFVGVTTPRTVRESTPTHFTENGNYVYDFCGGEDISKLASCLQKNVDDARANGADFVIVLGHVGNEDSVFNSEALIRATNGIDAFLDAHSHETYTKVCVENKDSQPVFLAQTGTGLSALGQLVITESGIVSVSLIDDLSKEDATVAAKLEAITADYTEFFNTVVAHSNAALSDKDAYGVRAVRNRETGIGNLCADAYRAVFDADIGYINGGGVRTGIPEGDITYQNIIDVNPFGNMLCLVEVTGQEVLDMLEYFVRAVQPESVTEDKKNAVGEDGSFPCISGLTFTVDTRIESPVILDENDMLIGVDTGKMRRVSEVMVESDGEYLPIDPNKTYTFASHDYMILKGGSGMKVFLAGHNVLQNAVTPDYQALVDYIVKDLAGDLNDYQTPQNRINFLR